MTPPRKPILPGASAVPTLGTLYSRGPQVGVRVACASDGEPPIYIAAEQEHVINDCLCALCDADVRYLITENEELALKFKDRDSALLAATRLEREQGSGSVDVWLEPIYSRRERVMSL